MQWTLRAGFASGLLLLLIGHCAAPGRVATDAGERGTSAGHLTVRGLTPFFRKLRAREKGADVLIRVLFFGDSIISGDNLTSQLREKFQARFGDGGAGIVPLVSRKYNRLRNSVNLTRGGFRLLAIPFGGLGMPDYPHHGFTGRSYIVQGWGAAVQRAATPPGRVRLILRGPAGGSATRVELRSGGATDVRTVELEPGECKVTELANQGSATVRVGFRNLRGRPFLDAMVLENDSGVALSTIVNLGLHQAWMQGVVSPNFECGFRAFAPDLLVFQSGINEAATMRNPRVNYTMSMYGPQLEGYYAKLAAALPNVPVLVIGPPERMIRGPRGWMVQPEVAPVARAQAEIAARRGQSFFDTHAALGGEGQMLRMMRTGLAHGDGTHITFRGGSELAERIFADLMRAYEDSR